MSNANPNQHSYSDDYANIHTNIHANLYGNQLLNPPSTPILIIDRHGEVHLLPFGIKSSEDLLKAIEPFLKDEM